jgi:hypothetical protein
VSVNRRKTWLPARISSCRHTDLCGSIYYPICMGPLLIYFCLFAACFSVVGLLVLVFSPLLHGTLLKRQLYQKHVHVHSRYQSRLLVEVSLSTCRCSPTSLIRYTCPLCLPFSMFTCMRRYMRGWSFRSISMIRNAYY